MRGRELKCLLYLINQYLNAVFIISYILNILNSEENSFLLHELNYSENLVFILHPSCNSQLKETLTNRDHEINSLLCQLDATNKELDNVGRSKEISCKENRRLQDDLATMARENQV